MLNADIPSLKKLIAETYECCGARVPSDGAMAQWFDALREHPFETVQSVLKTWLRTKTKPPVIADIALICAGMLSDRVEARAAADKAAFSKPPEWSGVTPYGSKCIAEMRALLAKPKRPSKEWARKIMENADSRPLAREFAAPIYAKMRERQPGEDDY